MANTVNISIISLFKTKLLLFEVNLKTINRVTTPTTTTCAPTTTTTTCAPTTTPCNPCAYSPCQNGNYYLFLRVFNFNFEI